MKKTLLLLFLLAACQSSSKLEDTEKMLYELDEVYVEISEEEMKKRFLLENGDVRHYIALTSLLIIEENEIIIFENPSERFIERCKDLLDGKVISFDKYLIYLSDENYDLLNQIKQSLSET